jgi:hypothetical protein
MADYRKALFLIKLKVGGLKYNLLAGETPCNLGIETDPEELKKLQFLKDSPVKTELKYNQNKSINWSVFKSYSDEYVYEPTCENFKEMPDEIWNTIFKKQYWDSISGDKIKNQGVANMISYIALKSNGVILSSALLESKLKEFGFKAKVKPNQNVFDFNISKLDDEYIDFINDLDAKGKSPELFDKLFFGYESDIIPLDQRKENENLINTFYILNKPYASSFKEKTLFIGGVLGVIGGLVILSRLE